MSEHLPFSNSGTAITLESGPYAATILTSGAALGSLTFHGVPLTLSYPATELAPGYAGKVLLPWPNRIRAGRYQWNNHEYQLPVNDAGTRTALHGYVHDRQWTVCESGPDAVSLELWIPACDGYPWPLHAHVHYSLDSVHGLTSTITTRNLSDSQIPFGVGVHPYLAPGGGTVDQWTLEFTADTAQRMDTSMLPSAQLPVSDLGINFAHQRPLDGVSIDTGFTDFSTPEWTVTVAHPHAGICAHLSSSAPWAQMYTGDAMNRVGIAVEPMSCPANAFNDTPEDVTLPPGATHHFSWSLRGELTPTAG